MTSPVLELNAAVKVVEIAVVLAAIAFMIKEKKKALGLWLEDQHLTPRSFYLFEPLVYLKQNEDDSPVYLPTYLLIGLEKIC